mmetsp:Transcript_149/g.359  ORF Transcript_149/g.359 Transcript_149/m.359 type:complete len:109 (+) Transcript_149:142-468(+)
MVWCVSLKPAPNGGRMIYPLALLATWDDISSFSCWGLSAPTSKPFTHPPLYKKMWWKSSFECFTYYQFYIRNDRVGPEHEFKSNQEGARDRISLPYHIKHLQHHQHTS